MPTDKDVDNVRAACAEVLQVDPDTVVPSADLREDLGAESIDLAELYTALIDHWGAGNLNADLFIQARTIANVLQLAPDNRD
ncbi:phosphopantetheine-binding protein [Actinomadura fulvescens]|uniref:Carrier domain-containing protein n=1 Tax=Actinomadura fulvescens TaxID=46160 RepID=A0ABN3Q1U2_9ACTN